MNTQKELIRKCEKLPYTKEKSLSNEVYDATVSELRDMWDLYGYASVLGVLAELWPFDAAVTFFKSGEEFAKDRRRIRTIATSYHKAYNGGVERVNAQLMNIWVNMGFNVILFTDEPENPLDYEYSESVKRIIIPKSNISSRLNALQQCCLEEKVDLFIYHDWTNQYMIWECMLMKMLHIYFAVYCHGHFAWNFKSGRSVLFQPECFRLCDMVLAISETNARFYQMCGCNTYLVQNPIPRELTIMETSVKLESNRILLIGRLAPEKYPLEALEIFKRVHDKMPGVVLDVVGDGIMMEAMNEYVAANQLNESVVFHGAKPESELDRYYREAACVLCTSKMEGFAMILLESMAYGIPFIMYEMPYLSLVKDNDGILCAPTGDIEKMSQHVLSVMSESDYRKTLGRKARDYFDNLREYNYTDMWNSIFEILCTDDSCDINWFTAKKLTTSEACVLPVLIDEIKVGYKNDIENNMYYKFGRAFLKPLKSIYGGIKKGKRSILG